MAPSTEPRQPAYVAEPGAWTALIVDDDPDVHLVTRLALANFHFDGRPLALISARSAAEARQVLATAEDIALILLDIVMETAQAGLELIRDIRASANGRLTRLVLRTGQPGEQSEREIIERFDVNEFWPKTELTAPKLRRVVQTGLRGYRNLKQIDRQRQELRQLSEMLEAERDFARALLAAAPVAVVLFDAEGRVRSANAFFQALTGLAAHELSAEPWLGRLVAESHRLALRRRLEQGEGADAAVFPLLLPGGERLLDWTVRTVSMAEGETARLAVGVDVTERRRQAEALERSEARLFQAQKMQAIGQLTGGVAHNFNNLLAIVLGNLELLAERAELAERPRSLLQQAIQATTRGGELTRSLLAFSRQQPLRPSVVRPDRVAAGMLLLLKEALADRYRITMRVKGDPWHCRVDSAQLESALLNLVLNARDAMPNGGEIGIEIGHAVDPDPGDGEPMPAGEYATVSVVDTGVGIPRELVPEVVRPFFTTKGPDRGTGLGLSTVQGFAKQSGGGLRIESEVGKGTTVRLFFPRTPEDEVATASGARPAVVRGDGVVVLVVEDAEAMRAVTVEALRGFGYVPLEAATAAQALEQLARHPEIAVVVSDVALPGGASGFDLSREAKRLRPDLRFLFVSGFPDAIAGGAAEKTDILRKPFAIRDLAARLGALRDAAD